MFWKKKTEQKTEQKIETTREVVMEITIVNNRTEKEYIIKSENDFGLDFETIDGWLHIQQLLSLDRHDWRCLSAVVDFSILKLNWKTININPEEISS